MKRGQRFTVAGQQYADVSNPPATTVVLRRRKGWQTRTTHSHIGSDCQTYSRKEGLVEIIKVDLPAGLDDLVMKAKEEFRRARKDGRLKKTAEPGKVTTIAWVRATEMDVRLRPSGEPTGEGPGFEKGPSAVPEAPSRALTMLPARRVLTCPDCGSAGRVSQENGFTYCNNPECPALKVKGDGALSPGVAAIREAAIEAGLKDIADRMTSTREALEDLTRLLLKG